MGPYVIRNNKYIYKVIRVEPEEFGINAREDDYKTFTLKGMNCKGFDSITCRENENIYKSYYNTYRTLNVKDFAIGCIFGLMMRINRYIRIFCPFY